MGKTNTGVARGAFDNGPAWRKLTCSLRRQNDELGSTILDRTARVQEFGLAEDLATGLLADAIETYQGCVANCIDEAVLVFQFVFLN